MKAYVLSIAGIVLVIAAISIIAPSGRMGSMIKGMGKLFILVVMVSPVVYLFTGKGQTLLRTAEIGTDEEYLERCAEILCERDEEEICAYLKESFSVTAEVRVARKETAGFERERITVKITDYGIIGQEGHIDRVEQVQRALVERYGCEAVVS